MMNWIIEGSNDRNNWIEIDRKENNHDLTGANFQQYFPISKTVCEFQYIRIKSIGKHSGGSETLIFSYFELFGEIIINTAE